MDDRLRNFEELPLDLCKIFENLCKDDDVFDMMVYSIPKNKYLLPTHVLNKGSNFRMAFLNCRGLLNIFDQISLFISHHNIDVFASCETFLNDSTKTFINKQDYTFFHKNRINKKQGGVGFFIKSTIQSDLVNEFDHLYLEMAFEFLAVKIDVNGMKILCCVCYQPPSFPASKFMELLDDFVLIASKNYPKIVFMGDFNIDLYNSNNSSGNFHGISSDGADLLSVCLSGGLLPAYGVPTRITKDSASLIDNLFTNLELKSSDVVIEDFSDHLMLVTDFHLITEFNRPTKKKMRMTNRNSLSKLKVLLSSSDFSSCLESSDPDFAAECFVNQFKRCFNNAFPLRQISRRNSIKPIKPWISPGLLVSIKNKNLLYKAYLMHPSEVKLAEFRRYKNYLTKILRSAKSHYFAEAFVEAEGSPKKTWEIINKCLGKHKTHDLPDELIAEDGTKLATGKVEVINALNIHFAKIGEETASTAGNNLARHLDNETGEDFQSYLPPSLNCSIFLTPVTPDELLLTTNLLKNGSSEGTDGSSTNLIKCIAPNIVNPLSHVFNLCFKTGRFPSCFKSARIISLYKGGDPKNPTNYRPISILSTFGKLLEKCLYNRIVSFLMKSKFFSPMQFGFRKSHSTEHAIMAMTQFVHDALDKGDIPATIFIDIKKVFDTISHKILHTKLDNCGIRGPVNDLVMSYLKNRNQYVDGGDTSSSSVSQSQSVGVPQGSILGPLLFLIYVNDISNSIKDIGLKTLFADDTACNFSSPDSRSLKLRLESALSRLILWFSRNKLTINCTKTKFIIFSRTGKTAPEIMMINIQSLPIEIERVDDIKYLGIILDSSLSFKRHAIYLRMKLARNIGMMNHLKFILPFFALKSLYHSLVHSYINYCPIIFLNTFKTHILPLQRQQNKALRLLKNFLPSPFSYPGKSSTKSMYQILNILPLDLFSSFHSVFYMIKHVQGLLPDYFYLHNNYFQDDNQVLHAYWTRGSSVVRQALIKSERSRFSPRHSIIYNWNKFHSFIDLNNSLVNNKIRLMNHLISNY